MKRGIEREALRAALERLVDVWDADRIEGIPIQDFGPIVEQARAALASTPPASESTLLIDVELLMTLVTLVRLGFLGHENESRITADRVKGQPYRDLLHTILSAKDVAEAVQRLASPQTRTPEPSE